MEIVVKSSHKLEKYQVNSIKEIASKKYSNADIKFIVDKSLIVGCVIYVNERIIDTSYKTKFDKLSKLINE